MMVVGLVRVVLLDMVPDGGLSDAVARTLEGDGDRVSDLHLWRVGPGHMALIVSVVSDSPRPPDEHKARLSGFRQLSHVTIEVHPCSRTRQAKL